MTMTSDRTELPDLSSLVPTGMRDEADAISAKIEAFRADMADDFVRAHQLNREAVKMADHVVQGAKAAGATHSDVQDGAWHLIMAMAGGKRLHDALQDLMDDVNPDEHLRDG